MSKKLATAAVLAGFIATPALFAAQPDYRIEVEKGARLVPDNVRSYSVDDGLRIEGVVKKWRPSDHLGRIRGHVDIEFLDTVNNLVGRTTTKLKGRSPSSRHAHRADFGVTLAELPEGTATLRIRHHFGGHDD